jgi:hypothetical protein
MFDNAELEQTVCEYLISHSIREIEHLLETVETPTIALSGTQVEILCRMAQIPMMPISLFFPRGSFV